MNPNALEPKIRTIGNSCIARNQHLFCFFVFHFNYVASKHDYGNLLNFISCISIGKKGILSDVKRGIIAGTKLAGLSTSKTAKKSTRIFTHN